MLAWRDVSTRLLPWIARGEDQYPIEAQLMEGDLGGVKMGHVDRIEGPAEYSGSHGHEDRAPAVSPDAALW